jgi:hypothetical protein
MILPTRFLSNPSFMGNDDGHRQARCQSSIVLNLLSFQNIANCGRIPLSAVTSGNSPPVQTITNSPRGLNASGFDLLNNRKHLGSEFHRQGKSRAFRAYHSKNLETTASFFLSCSVTPTTYGQITTPRKGRSEGSCCRQAGKKTLLLIALSFLYVSFWVFPREAISSFSSPPRRKPFRPDWA